METAEFNNKFSLMSWIKANPNIKVVSINTTDNPEMTSLCVWHIFYIKL